MDEILVTSSEDSKQNNKKQNDPRESTSMLQSSIPRGENEMMEADMSHVIQTQSHSSLALNILDKQMTKEDCQNEKVNKSIEELNNPLLGFLSKTVEAKGKLNNKVIDLLPVIDTSVDFEIDYDADNKKALVGNKSKGVLDELNIDGTQTAEVTNVNECEKDRLIDDKDMSLHIEESHEKMVVSIDNSLKEEMISNYEIKNKLPLVKMKIIGFEEGLIKLSNEVKTEVIESNFQIDQKGSKEVGSIASELLLKTIKSEAHPVELLEIKLEQDNSSVSELSNIKVLEGFNREKVVKIKLKSSEMSLEVEVKPDVTAIELTPDTDTLLSEVKPSSKSIQSRAEAAELVLESRGLVFETDDDATEIELQSFTGNYLLPVKENANAADLNAKTIDSVVAIGKEANATSGSLKSVVSQEARASEIALFIKDFVSEVKQTKSIIRLGLDTKKKAKEIVVTSEEDNLVDKLKENGRFNTSDIKGNVEYIQVDEFDISTTNPKCRLHDNIKSDRSTESNLKTKVVRAGRISKEHLSWIDLQNELNVEVITAHQNCMQQHIKILQSNIWITETRLEQLSCINFIRKARLKRKLRFYQENLLEAEIISEKLSIEC